MLLLTQKLFNIIPDSYPVTCEDGWLLQVNPNETRINCTNELCPIDNSLKLDKALDILEIDCKVGPVRALQLVEALELEHHMDIFNKLDRLELYEENMQTADVTNLNHIIRYMNNIEDNPVDLFKFMNCWGLEQLGTTSSQKIFSGFTDLEDFYEKTSSHPLDRANLIGERLNISPYCDTVNTIVHFMKRNKKFLIDTSRNFKFKDAKIGTVTIAITGQISLSRRSDGSMYKPRNKFAEELADKYGININYNNHITQKTDYLICDSDNGHTKINKVKNNPDFKKVELLNSIQFEEMIKNLTNKIETPNEIKSFS